MSKIKHLLKSFFNCCTLFCLFLSSASFLCVIGAVAVSLFCLNCSHHWYLELWQWFGSIMVTGILPYVELKQLHIRFRLSSSFLFFQRFGDLYIAFGYLMLAIALLFSTVNTFTANLKTSTFYLPHWIPSALAVFSVTIAFFVLLSRYFFRVEK